MPTLITPEEALRLGELQDHAEIEALVQRAWDTRVQRFGDATDMCSLVNAKSGGCAEDCGFCAQSKYAEAETREQRVEMAFQLAAINPTSVPINLLNPRPGTKFGDRDVMDPWEVVKWIAIFRLILPEALFRLCGGRVENLGELQATAVKAGLNGVMMGNFLTTLGNTPEEDRSMFEELGLNVAPQPDNGANPRPDNRSGWLAGETPDGPVALAEPPEPATELNVRLWDPSSQLRFSPKRHVPPRPDGARNAPRARA